MSNFFILDIETKPDEKFLPLFESEIKPDGRIKDAAKQEAYKKKKSAETYHKSMAVDTDMCKIFCIGIKQIDAEPKLYNLEDMPEWFMSNPDFKFITFNGKSFDLPIIIKAGIKYGLDFPYSTLIAMTKKYAKIQDSGHCDLMQLINFDSSINKAKKLDTYLQIYLDIQKETAGNDFFETCTDDELRQHCLDDLVLTEKLFLKFSFLLK